MQKTPRGTGPDDIAEIITGAGPGGGPHVRAWSVLGGTLTELTGFFA